MKAREGSPFDPLIQQVLACYYLYQGGKLVVASPSVCELLGYSPEELQGRSEESWVAPKDLELVRDKIRQLLSGTERFAHYSYLAVRQNGREVAVEVLEASTRFEGQPAIVGAFLELPERVRMRRAFDELERRYDEFVKKSPAIFLAFDCDGTVTVSEGRLTGLGLRPGDILGRRIDEVEQDLPWLVEGARKSLDGRENTAVGNKNGDRFEIKFAPVRNDLGEVSGAIAIGIRVVQRRTDAELKFLSEAGALLASSLDFETTLNRVVRLAVPNFSDCCAVHLLEGESQIRCVAIAHSDPKLAEIANRIKDLPLNIKDAYGVPEVVRTGKPRIVLDHADMSDFARVRSSEYLRILESLGLRAYLIVPMSVRAKMIGTMTFAQYHAGRHYSADDVSFAEDLASRCALAVDNARLYRQAQEAIQVREDLLSIASHELKTPLTSLQSLVEVLLMNVKSNREPGDGLVRLLERSAAQNKKVSGLIDNLLDLSRLRLGRLELHIEHVCIADVIHDTLERMWPERDVAGSDISVDASTRLCGSWDRFRIEQVVANLISNALRYGQGKPIRIEAEGDEHIVRMHVRDQGIGIAPEDRKRIFERYQRASFRQRSKGLGLGLYIVREIVEAHGGSIRLESEVGRGSTFTVELPTEAGVSPAELPERRAA